MSEEDRDNERINAQSVPNDVTCWRGYNQAADIKARERGEAGARVSNFSFSEDQEYYTEGVYYVHTYSRMLYTQIIFIRL